MNTKLCLSMVIVELSCITAQIIPYVKVQVYYSPFSKTAADFIVLNTKGNAKGLWDLMEPKYSHVDDYKLEVDYIPWGRATRVQQPDGQYVYNCPNGDTDCVGTRLHACIARNHVVTAQNHHNCFMILCTLTQADFKLTPTKSTLYCAKVVNDRPENGTALALCAQPDSANGNHYLDETLAVTDALYPPFEQYDSDTLVVINGKRNTIALTNLRKQVCLAFKTQGFSPKECT